MFPFRLLSIFNAGVRFRFLNTDLHFQLSYIDLSVLKMASIAHYGDGVRALFRRPTHLLLNKSTAHNGCLILPSTPWTVVHLFSNH